MGRHNKAKEEKELKRRYGKLAESMESYYHHLDLRPLDELNDEAFAYIIKNVKGINMLDLNETEIGNKSITLLTGLEYVKELQLKQCRQLDNDCIDDLNRLTELEFLHVKSTAITIDGLLRLTALTKLKELMFSADDADNIKEKMLQLKQQLPGCAFTVNSKPWYFEEE